MPYPGAFDPDPAVRTALEGLLLEVFLELDVVLSDGELDLCFLAIHISMPGFATLQTAFLAAHRTAQVHFLLFG